MHTCDLILENYQINIVTIDISGKTNLNIEATMVLLC